MSTWSSTPLAVQSSDRWRQPSPASNFCMVSFGTVLCRLERAERASAEDFSSTFETWCRGMGASDCKFKFLFVCVMLMCRRVLGYNQPGSKPCITIVNNLGNINELLDRTSLAKEMEDLWTIHICIRSHSVRRWIEFLGSPFVPRDSQSLSAGPRCPGRATTTFDRIIRPLNLYYCFRFANSSVFSDTAALRWKFCVFRICTTQSYWRHSKWMQVSEGRRGKKFLGHAWRWLGVWFDRRWSGWDSQGEEWRC